MRKSYLILFIILLSCSSGKKALQKGNYEEAIYKAISRLKSSPGNKNARETLKQGYQLTTEFYLNRINNIQSSNQLFKNDGTFDAYSKLNAIYEDIQRCPACLQVVGNNARPYYNEMNQVRSLAAEERYSAGVAAFDRDNSRESAKEAYFHFLRANQIMPNYKDVQTRINISKFEATLKILFEQVPVYSRAYGLSNEYFQNQINQFVNSEKMNDFVKFYTPDEAKTVGLQKPDQIVRMQFDDFVVGQVYMKENNETFQKDSVVVGQVKVGDVNKNVYGSVKAKMTTYQKTVTSNGIMDLQVIDPNLNKVLYQEKIPGQFVWLSQWGNFQGDERALTQNQLKICQTREVPPPPPQQLFIEFCKPIYAQSTNSLRRFYKNY